MNVVNVLDETTSVKVFVLFSDLGEGQGGMIHKIVFFAEDTLFSTVIHYIATFLLHIRTLVQ